jgi:hypothetical protein
LQVQTLVICLPAINKAKSNFTYGYQALYKQMMPRQIIAQATSKARVLTSRGQLIINACD